jgi:hypothetical protein
VICWRSGIDSENGVCCCESKSGEVECGGIRDERRNIEEVKSLVNS